MTLNDMLLRMSLWKGSVRLALIRIIAGRDPVAVNLLIGREGAGIFLEPDATLLISNVAVERMMSAVTQRGPGTMFIGGGGFILREPKDPPVEKSPRGRYPVSITSQATKQSPRN